MTEAGRVLRIVPNRSHFTLSSLGPSSRRLHESFSRGPFGRDVGNTIHNVLPSAYCVDKIYFEILLSRESGAGIVRSLDPDILYSSGGLARLYHGGLRGFELRDIPDLRGDHYGFTVQCVLNCFSILGEFRQHCDDFSVVHVLTRFGLLEDHGFAELAGKSMQPFSIIHLDPTLFRDSSLPDIKAMGIPAFLRRAGIEVVENYEQAEAAQSRPAPSAPVIVSSTPAASVPSAPAAEGVKPPDSQVHTNYMANDVAPLLMALTDLTADPSNMEAQKSFRFAARFLAERKIDLLVQFLNDPEVSRQAKLAVGSIIYLNLPDKNFDAVKIMRAIAERMGHESGTVFLETWGVAEAEAPAAPRVDCRPLAIPLHWVMGKTVHAAVEMPLPASFSATPMLQTRFETPIGRDWITIQREYQVQTDRTGRLGEAANKLDRKIEAAHRSAEEEQKVLYAVLLVNIKEVCGNMKAQHDLLNDQLQKVQKLIEWSEHQYMNHAGQLLDMHVEVNDLQHGLDKVEEDFKGLQRDEPFFLFRPEYHPPEWVGEAEAGLSEVLREAQHNVRRLKKLHDKFGGAEGTENEWFARFIDDWNQVLEAAIPAAWRENPDSQLSDAQRPVVAQALLGLNTQAAAALGIATSEKNSMPAWIARKNLAGAVREILDLLKDPRLQKALQNKPFRTQLLELLTKLKWTQCSAVCNFLKMLTGYSLAALPVMVQAIMRHIDPSKRSLLEMISRLPQAGLDPATVERLFTLKRLDAAVEILSRMETGYMRGYGSEINANLAKKDDVFAEWLDFLHFVSFVSPLCHPNTADKAWKNIEGLNATLKQFPVAGNVYSDDVRAELLGSIRKLTGALAEGSARMADEKSIIQRLAGEDEIHHRMVEVEGARLRQLLTGVIREINVSPKIMDENPNCYHMMGEVQSRILACRCVMNPRGSRSPTRVTEIDHFVLPTSDQNGSPRRDGRTYEIKNRLSAYKFAQQIFTYSRLILEATGNHITEESELAPFLKSKAIAQHTFWVSQLNPDMIDLWRGINPMAGEAGQAERVTLGDVLGYLVRTAPQLDSGERKLMMSQDVREAAEGFLADFSAVCADGLNTEIRIEIAP